MEILFGLHPVEEALRSGTRKFDHICIARERQDVRLEKLIQACRDAGVKMRLDTRDQLTKLARTEAHQGVVAIVRARQFLDVDDLLSDAKENRLLLALDGVEDPQNLGALLRTAEGAGVDGVVVTERRSAPLSPVAVKASAGRGRAREDRPGGEPGAHPGRVEAAESVDHRPGRARHHEL